MAIANWNPATQHIEIGTHSMSGKPMGLPFDDAYAQPIDASRQKYVADLLSTLYPQQPVQIIGAPWDYARSDQPSLHNGTPVGDYRVKIGNADAVLTVSNIDGSQAIALGAEVFEAFRNNGVDVAGPVKLKIEGQDYWSANHQGFFVHLSDYVEGSKALLNAGLQSRQADIGRMAGGMYNAGMSLRSPLIDQISQFSEDTTMRAWRDGFALVDALDMDAGFAELEQQFRQTGSPAPDLKAHFIAAVGSVKTEVENVLQSNDRLGTSFNMIEKMVKERPDGTLFFSSYDTPSRGYVPMMTENATYDAGVALYRVVMDKRLYAADATSQDVQQGVQTFIDAYNLESGLRLTVTEAVQAAKVANALDTVISLGFMKNSPKGDQITLKDIVSHIYTNKIPHMQTISAFEAHLGAP